jgi:hypothetical protein
VGVVPVKNEVGERGVDPFMSLQSVVPQSFVKLVFEVLVT